MTSRPSPVTSFTAGFSTGSAAGACSAAGARRRAPVPGSLPAAAAVNAL
jgi:hypothetical protein